MGYCLNTVANFISSNFDFPSAENLSILGDMLPASNEVFNLGSDDMKWKDLYLSGETIYLGKSKITNDASSGISFRDESNNTINLTVSSISIQDPSQQNKKVTIQVDSDENVSNYVKTTSNNISTRLTNTSNNISIRITNLQSNVSNYIENTSNDISIRMTNLQTNTSNYIENTSNEISMRLTNINTRLTNINTNVSNYIENTSNDISMRLTNINTNVSNYIENTSNDISMRLTNIDTNVSNYIENTSNDISTRLTNIDTNVSNYIENTSNNISMRLTNIDTNVSNYIENTSNDISMRITGIVNSIVTERLFFETKKPDNGSTIDLLINTLSMKTNITLATIEFIHTFDVSISLDNNSLYHIILFIVYNEDKSFKEIRHNVMFSYYPIDDIVVSDSKTNIEFQTLKLIIRYSTNKLEIINLNENNIDPIVNIISR
jgi:hypothetical protein